MNLKIQIISFIFSFIYGIFLFILIFLQRKILFCRNKRRKIFTNSLFCIVISILYFIFIYFINNGVLHLYFLLLIIFGFLVAYNYVKKYVK